MPNLRGQTLKGRYRIDELLGRGGMAEVYRAWDTWRNYHVAIKVMREDLAEDLEFLRRFRREAGTLAALSHANIVRFYSFEQEGQLAFMVMDYVSGTTLRTEIAVATGPLPLDLVASVAQQVCDALHYAHQEGVIHRDIKPGNIMFRADGQVLVTDFGIAKAADAATATTVMPGTPAYMSPEQCRSEPLDARTDIYSLGIVVYEMSTGQRPFVGESRSEGTASTQERIRWEQMHADPPPLRLLNPAVPAEVEAVVLKALAKERDHRWPTALAISDALRNALAMAAPGASHRSASRATPSLLPHVRIAEPAQHSTTEAPPTPSGVVRQRPMRVGTLPAQRRLAWAWIVGTLALMAIALLVVWGGGDDTLATITPALPTVVRSPTVLPVVTVAPSLPALTPGNYPVRRWVSLDLGHLCGGQPFGGLVFGVETVDVLATGELQVNVSWMWRVTQPEREHCPRQSVQVYSDAGNTRMYLTDELGRRYDHTAVGGRTGEDTVLEPNVAERGWFLFAPPATDSPVFAFHDDDNQFVITSIDLRPAP